MRPRPGGGLPPDDARYEAGDARLMLQRVLFEEPDAQFVRPRRAFKALNRFSTAHTFTTKRAGRDKFQSPILQFGADSLEER